MGLVTGSWLGLITSCSWGMGRVNALHAPFGAFRPLVWRVVLVRRGRACGWTGGRGTGFWLAVFTQRWQVARRWVGINGYGVSWLPVKVVQHAPARIVTSYVRWALRLSGEVVLQGLGLAGLGGGAGNMGGLATGNMLALNNQRQQLQQALQLQQQNALGKSRPLRNGDRGIPSKSHPGANGLECKVQALFVFM